MVIKLFLPVCLFFCLSLNSQNTVIISISDVTINAGEDFVIAIKTEDFVNVSSFSFGLKWDETLIDFDTITSLNTELSLNSSNFNMSPSVTDSGELAISWFDISGSGKSLTDSSAIFEIRFKALSNQGTTVLGFSDELAPIIAENLQGLLPVTTIPGTITIQTTNSNSELNPGINMGIFPNPANETVLIKYTSVFPSPIVAEVFDLNGRFIELQEKENVLMGELKLETSSVPTGNYIIRLTSNKGSVAKVLTVVR